MNNIERLKEIISINDGETDEQYCNRVHNFMRNLNQNINKIWSDEDNRRNFCNIVNGIQSNKEDDQIYNQIYCNKYELIDYTDILQLFSEEESIEFNSDDLNLIDNLHEMIEDIFNNIGNIIVFDEEDLTDSLEEDLTDSLEKDGIKDVSDYYLGLFKQEFEEYNFMSDPQESCLESVKIIYNAILFQFNINNQLRGTGILNQFFESLDSDNSYLIQKEDIKDQMEHLIKCLGEEKANSLRDLINKVSPEFRDFAAPKVTSAERVTGKRSADQIDEENNGYNPKRFCANNYEPHSR